MPIIMVVDDDEDFTNLYKEYLRMVGFDAVAENQSSKAMELAYSVNPDVFVLDLMMPEPDGFQLCRMLRQTPIFNAPPSSSSPRSLIWTVNWLPWAQEQMITSPSPSI